MSTAALDPEAAAALLAAAGVRSGDVVLVVDGGPGGGLLARAAAAAVGARGTVLQGDPAAPVPGGVPPATSGTATTGTAPPTGVARVLAALPHGAPEVDRLTGRLVPGGRLTALLRPADADALVGGLTAAGWSLRHRARVPHGLEVVALVAPA